MSSASSDVLEIFFHVHDPTTKNRQGNDVGHAVPLGHLLHETPEQERVAGEVLGHGQCGARRASVVTEVKALANYSKAEAYHQHYFARNPGAGLLRLRGGAEGREVQEDLHFETQSDNGLMLHLARP